MAGKLHVSVVTPLGAVTRKDVDSVTAPGRLGELTILPEHVPLLTQIDAGVVTMRAGDGVDIYAVSGGFLEVERDNVVLLADTAERPEEIDIQRSEGEIKEANERLATLDGYDPEYATQQAVIKRNEARVRAAGS